MDAEKYIYHAYDSSRPNMYGSGGRYHLGSCGWQASDSDAFAEAKRLYPDVDTKWLSVNRI
jgi:hypothetical protein